MEGANGLQEDRYLSHLHNGSQPVHWFLSLALREKAIKAAEIFEAGTCTLCLTVTPPWLHICPALLNCDCICYNFTMNTHHTHFQCLKKKERDSSFIHFSSFFLYLFWVRMKERQRNRQRESRLNSFLIKPTYFNSIMDTKMMFLHVHD